MLLWWCRLTVVSRKLCTTKHRTESGAQRQLAEAVTNIVLGRSAMIAGLDMYSEIAEGNSSHVGVWQKTEERESCRDESLFKLGAAMVESSANRWVRGTRWLGSGIPFCSVWSEVGCGLLADTRPAAPFYHRCCTTCATTDPMVAVGKPVDSYSSFHSERVRLTDRQKKLERRRLGENVFSVIEYRYHCANTAHLQKGSRLLAVTYRMSWTP
jgi:hypothetical protein